MIRDAPGTPDDFFEDLSLNQSFDTVLDLSSYIEDPDPCSCSDSYNSEDFMNDFPNCKINDTTVDCLYDDRSASDLDTLCRLSSVIPGTECNFGLLNNFQVGMH